MGKNLKIIFIIISLLLSALAILYFSTKAKSRDNNILTLNDIKENYKIETIKNIEQFDSHYVLVNIIDNNSKDLFEIYNLKTGDRDILPTLPYKVTINKIINKNDIEFLANGENYESISTTFPFKIICHRNVENIKSNLDFTPTYENLYLHTEENVTLGRDVKSIISEVNLSLNGLEVLFGPVSKEDLGYFSDETNIPITNTQYIKEKNQLVINFTNTTFNKDLLKDKTLMYSSNLYYKSIELSESNINTYILINLKETGTNYNIEVNRLENLLPFVRIIFKK